ncbi:MAG: O-antigen ligase family protein [Candidatus Kaiserbacteria bacterium]|nr:O-antigen ligase family protein [Candidatus Kaiserbacteria bacterium]
MKYLLERIEKVYPWILLSPVILPLVIWGELIYPYLVPKTLLFYLLTFIALALFVLLVAYGRSFFWSRLRRWETWIPGALLLLAYTTSAFGIDFYRSFWSLFVRGDGLLMLTCVVTSFYLILLSADRAFFERLLRATAIVATSVALYGIGEWFISGGRIGSLLGNAAFFAGYLGITFFATLVAAQSLSKTWQRVAYVGALLQFIAILFTATRGTLLALIVALLVALVHLAVFARGAKQTWGRGILVALIIFAGLFFSFRNQLAQIPFEPISRIASVSTTENDVASRLFVWKNMFGEIQKSPWIGVGAEHIDVLFNRFYDPTLISEQWFDRSHNAFLDYIAQYGIGGLLLYLLLIGTFLTTAARYAKKYSRPVAGFVVLLTITYAIQNFFVFDTVSSFWLLLALLAGFMAVSDERDRTEVSFPRSAAWLGVLGLLMLIIPVSVRPAFAAYDLMQAYKYQLVDVSREVAYLSHGFALGTYGDLEYGYTAYDMYANTQATKLSGEERVNAYQATLSIVTANFNRYTYDARTALYLSHILSLAPQETIVDQNLISSALERAIRLSEKRSQPWYILANLAIGSANRYPANAPERIAGYAAARDILTKYIGMVPNLSLPHFILAQLLYASGKSTEAALEAEKGNAHYTKDLETASRAASYYETVLDLPHAAFYLEEVVRLDPSNTGAQSDLAKIKAYEQSKR